MGLPGRRPIPPEVGPAYESGSILPHLHPNRLRQSDIQDRRQDAGYGRWWSEVQGITWDGGFPTAGIGQPPAGQPVAIARTDDIDAPISGVIGPGMVVAIAPGLHYLTTALPPEGYTVRRETDQLHGACARGTVRMEPILPTTQAPPQEVSLSGDQLPFSQSVSAGGSGYDNNNRSQMRPIAYVIGDGTGGAVSSLSVNTSGVITSVSFSPRGEGYTWARVVFVLPPLPRERWHFAQPFADGTYNRPTYRVHTADGYDYTRHWMPDVGQEYGLVPAAMTAEDWTINGVPTKVGMVELPGLGIPSISPQHLAWCPNSYGVRRWALQASDPTDGAFAEYPYHPDEGVAPIWRAVWTDVSSFGGLLSMDGWRYYRDPALYVDGELSKGIKAVFIAEIDGAGTVTGFDRRRQGLGYVGVEGFTVDTDGDDLEIELVFNDDYPGAGFVEGIAIIDGGSNATFVTVTIDDPSAVPLPNDAFGVKLTDFNNPGAPTTPTGQITIEEDTFLVDFSDEYFDDYLLSADVTHNIAAVWRAEAGGGGGDGLWLSPVDQATAQANEDSFAATHSYPAEGPAVGGVGGTPAYYIYDQFYDEEEQEDIVLLGIDGFQATYRWHATAWQSARVLGDGSKVHITGYEARYEYLDEVLRDALRCVWIETWQPPRPLPFTTPGPAGVAWGALPE